MYKKISLVMVMATSVVGAAEPVIFDNIHKLVLVQAGVPGFEIFLNESPWYFSHRYEKDSNGIPTERGLVKLVEQAVKAFMKMSPDEMITQLNKPLILVPNASKVPAKTFIANLYDIIRGDKKMIKEASLRDYGMYRTTGLFRNHYYVGNEKAPFLTQRKWHWKQAIAAVALASAAYLAYRNSETIGSKASDIYANNPWMQNANAYVQSSVKKAGEGLNNAYYGVKNRAINLWDKARGRTWGDRYGEHVRQKEAQEKVVRDAQRLNKDLLREQNIEYTRVLEQEQAQNKRVRELNTEYEAEQALQEKAVQDRKAVRRLNKEYEKGLEQSEIDRIAAQEALEAEQALMKKEQAQNKRVRKLDKEYEAELAQAEEARENEQASMEQAVKNRKAVRRLNKEYEKGLEQSEIDRMAAQQTLEAEQTLMQEQHAKARELNNDYETQLAQAEVAREAEQANMEKAVQDREAVRMLDQEYEKGLQQSEIARVAAQEALEAEQATAVEQPLVQEAQASLQGLNNEDEVKVSKDMTEHKQARAQKRANRKEMKKARKNAGASFEAAMPAKRGSVRFGRQQGHASQQEEAFEAHEMKKKDDAAKQAQQRKERVNRSRYRYNKDRFADRNAE